VIDADADADGSGLRQLVRLPIGGRYTELAWKTKVATQAPGETG
jgi:hypothetical protein